jgi:RHS repeat-associated protein
VAYHVYYPYGEEATAFNQDGERLKFTGHERDLASAAGAGDDLDYMHARHESPIAGRFLSTDSHAGEPRLPQSWNRYAYVEGNPMKLIDLNGRCAVPAGLQPGQVGICLESFIAAPHIGVIGLGDNRSFAVNDPKTTFRTSLRVLVDPKSGKMKGTLKAGESDILFRGFGRFGTATLEQASGLAQNGSHVYLLYITGSNGLSALNAFGQIGFTVNMKLDSTGVLTIDPSSKTKGFPSIEGFAYRIIEGALVTQILFTVPEQVPSKLKGPMDVPLAGTPAPPQ